MNTGSSPRSDEQGLLPGVLVCLVTTLAVALGVLYSPYGSFFFLDENFGPVSVIAPVAAGAVVGLLQTLAFGVRATLISAGAIAAIGSASILFMFPAVTCAFGCALGGFLGVTVRRHSVQPSARVPVLLLATFSLVIDGSAVIRQMQGEAPLIRVLESGDGPSVLVDQEERIKATQAFGILADVDGCLGLVNSSVGDGTVLVLWRRGTTVSSDPFRLTVDGKTYGLGDKVVVPGAGLLTRERDLEAYRPDMPDSCAGHDLFM